MNALRKPREWTPEQRQEQSRLLRDRQIWLKSTGPRTEQGKATSSRNARHADYEYRQAQRTEMRLITAYLRTQKSYTDLLRFFCKQGDSMSSHRYYAMAYQLFFLENELRDIERNLFGGLLFSELSAAKNSNIIPFPTSRPPST
jgi:hypothetical protein